VGVGTIHTHIFPGYETEETLISEKCARIALMPDRAPPPAMATIPVYLELTQSNIAKGVGMHTKINLKAGLVFGPFAGVPDTEVHGKYVWRVCEVQVVECGSFICSYTIIHLAKIISSMHNTRSRVIGCVG
jgi:hypothetical protein